MRIIKQILNYIFWVFVSFIAALTYLRILLGPSPENEHFFSFVLYIIYQVSFIKLVPILGTIIALLFILFDAFYLTKKQYYKTNKIIIRFITVVAITLIVGLVHYILEKKIVFVPKIVGQDLYIVTAESGLNVREAGILKSKKIGKLAYGTLVEKIGSTDVSLTLNDKGKQITGTFVNIKTSNLGMFTQDLQGYVFDGYLKKYVDDSLLNIVEIDQETYNRLTASALINKAYQPNKISDKATVQALLKDQVTWYEDDFIKSIAFDTGEKLSFEHDMVDFGFSEGQSAYYPDEKILVLEGGHSSDVCFSLKTGETELTIGNPEYSIPSPKNTYRLNGYFGGQECITYFFQKYENGKYTYVTTIDWDYDICVFKSFKWVSEQVFIYIKMDYTEDAENGKEVYYKGELLKY